MSRITPKVLENDDSAKTTKQRSQKRCWIWFEYFKIYRAYERSIYLWWWLMCKILQVLVDSLKEKYLYKFRPIDIFFWILHLFIEMSNKIIIQNIRWFNFTYAVRYCRNFDFCLVSYRYHINLSKFLTAVLKITSMDPFGFFGWFYSFQIESSKCLCAKQNANCGVLLIFYYENVQNELLQIFVAFWPNKEMKINV